MKTILRALANIVLFIITIPIRIIVLIFTFAYCVYGSVKYNEPLSEWIEKAVTSMKQTFKCEVEWVKTGDVSSYKELL